MRNACSVLIVGLAMFGLTDVRAQVGMLDSGH